MLYKNLPLNLRDNTLTGRKNFLRELTHLPIEFKPPPGTIQSPAPYMVMRMHLSLKLSQALKREVTSSRVKMSGKRRCL